MHKLYQLKDMLCDELEQMADSDRLTAGSLETIDKLAHAAKNVAKIIEVCEDEEYSRDGGSYRDGGMSHARYSRGGYYYDDGISTRRGRARNGRFVSRDASDFSRKLREMMDEAPNDNMRAELQKLMNKAENM